MKLKKLKAGSYETEDGTYFTYKYTTDDGTRTGWLLYAKCDNGLDDAYLGFFNKLSEAKSCIITDIEYMNR